MPLTPGSANQPLARIDLWLRPPGSATTFAVVEDTGSWPVGMTVAAVLGDLNADGVIASPLLTVPLTITGDTAAGSITGAQATTLEAAVPWGQSTFWHIRGTLAGVVTALAVGFVKWDTRGKVSGTQLARIIVGPAGPAAGGDGTHNALTARDAADAHPISAVTGLQAALDGKASSLGADDNYVTDAEKAALHGHSNKMALDLVSGTNTGDQTLPTWSTISGKPAVVAAGATQADARTAIGAGTSSLEVGTTAGTAAEGNDPRIVAAVPNTRTITAGTGLTGGGDLSADRTLTVAYGTSGTTAAAGNDARLSDARTPTAHNHAASDINAGTMATARLGSGSASSTTYLRGDSTWAAAPDAWTYAVATGDSSSGDAGATVNISGLSATNLADGLYEFTMLVRATSQTTGCGVQVGITAPAGCTVTALMIAPNSAPASAAALTYAYVATTNGSIVAAPLNASVTTGPFIAMSARGTIRAASMSGDLVATIKAELTGAGTSVTAKADSFLAYRRIAS